MPEPHFKRIPEKCEHVMMNATIWVDGEWVPRTVRVRTLSSWSATVSGSPGLREGMAARIAVGRAPDVAAIVAWVMDDVAGMSFDEPVDLAVARRPRIVEANPGEVPVQAGWMAGMSDPYRRPLPARLVPMPPAR